MTDTQTRQVAARTDVRLQTLLHVTRRLRAGMACQVLVGDTPWVIEAVADPSGDGTVYVARDAGRPGLEVIESRTVAALLARLQIRPRNPVA